MEAINKKICIGIVSKERAELLAKIIKWTKKSYPNINILVCATKESDIPAELDRFKGIQIMYGESSIPIQRNLIIRQMQDLFEYILFIDDDTLIHPTYLQKAISFLDNNPDIVAFSGLLLKNGASFEEGEKILLGPIRNKVKNKNFFRDSGKHWVLYGCNMVIRSSLFKKEKFDEAFKDYALFEDVEFSLRAVRHGRVGHYNGCFAVHLQVKAGRYSPLRMTYADIINNHHILFRKKLIISHNYTWCFFRFFFRILSFNTVKRFLQCILQGHWNQARKVWIGFGIAVFDICSGKACPERVLRLPD